MVISRTWHFRHTLWVHAGGRDNIIAALPGRPGSPTVMYEAHMDTVGLSGKANRLLGAPSPYLQQHAYNPVDWYPWGEEAFAKARKENKVNQAH